MLHPIIIPRIHKMVKVYEELVLETEKVNDEFVMYCKGQKNFLKLLKTLEDQQLELSKQPGFFAVLMEERQNILHSINAVYQEQKPHLAMMIYKTQPLFDTIMNFKSVFIPSLNLLLTNAKHKKKSIEITDDLEKQLNSLPAVLATIHARFNKVKEYSDEASRQYSKLIN